MPVLKVSTTCIFLTLLMYTSQATMNIALYKNASQSSNYKETEYLAYLGVNGNRSWDRSQCTHTAPFTKGTLQPREAWWQVDLGSPSEIRSVEIYYHRYSAKRLNNFKLYLSNTSEAWRNETPCYVDTDLGYPAAELTIICTGYGKYITVFNNHTFHFQEPIMELCEVEVYGCPIGEYGPGCNDTCPSNCVNERCDPDIGSCKACPLGMYGTYCTSHCHCLKGSCDIVSGVCVNPGCHDGWKGNSCNERCSYNTFGTNCSRKCNCRIEGCNNVNGKCNTTGCKEGWKGDSCSKSCEKNHFGRDCYNACHCNIGTCDRMVGRCNISGCQVGWYGESCSTECADDTYGPDCVHKCSCLNGGCDSKTGICFQEGCKPGWTGKRCIEKCRNGTFGSGCVDHCYCKTGDCHHIYGLCAVRGCISGWQGESCSERVAANQNFVYAVIGGIIGLVLATIAFLLLKLFFFWRKRLKSKSEKETVYEDTHTNDAETTKECAYDELQVHGLKDYVNTTMSTDTPEKYDIEEL